MTAESDVKDQTQMNLASQDEGEIIGYADPWVVSPGQKVSVKVSRRLEA